MLKKRKDSVPNALSSFSLQNIRPRHVYMDVALKVFALQWSKSVSEIVIFI